MRTPDCLLAFLVPKTVEEAFVDRLLESGGRFDHCVITPADVVGASVKLHGLTEEVRGRSRRVQVQVLTSRDDARILMDEMAQAFPSVDIAWWLVPCEAGERLG